MPLPEFLKARREDILRIAARHGAYNVRFFGSLVRGDATECSDVDVLVDVEQGRSLLDIGALSEDLKTLLGREVDIVTERGLRERIRRRVLQEAVLL